MDEIQVIRVQAIHLNEFGQPGQLSNLQALSVTVERPLNTTLTRFLAHLFVKGSLPNIDQVLNNAVKERALNCIYSLNLEIVLTVTLEPILRLNTINASIAVHSFFMHVLYTWIRSACMKKGWTTIQAFTIFRNFIINLFSIYNVF